ncbi:MAG: outer membrane beta-barrel protein [Bryobacteraceae bacterium]
MQLRFLLLLLAVAASAAAQPPKVSLGLSAGYAGDDTPRRIKDSSGFTIGPRVDLSFTGHIELTVNLLYRRTGQSSDNFFFPADVNQLPPQASVFVGSISRGRSLELPVIGSYHFGSASRSWRPFLGAGFALRTQWGDTTSTLLRRGPDDQPRYDTFRGSIPNNVGAGVVTAAGVTLRQGRFVFVPEVRYTYWGERGPGSPRSQAHAMLSIRF